ncbi:isoaspartyl peptidase/L-asparaginase family protein [Mesoterricola silvestris]|uniref:Isoaspartyl peptidase n=1 Tax=Mesoterricola silvestris TaxID=2927979 RepID=A0AA48GYF1_9BACT|nr:isoaspartyl peptidase/L-asparaginase [Mesoterricola silvestris]BDU72658.1 isoaspartyl peptidase/L-asparaginase [Mesoterricola silvestris]
MFRSLLLLLAALCAHGAAPFGLAVHGGAGNVTAARIGPEAEKAYRAGLEKALAAGYAILEKGGAALDAVEAAVRSMEENPLFNAGVGATITRDGTHELDAAIMDGRTLKAGSVAGIQHVKSPVGLARLVMERTPHVMLIGEGAEAFARAQGLEPVPNTYFRTPRQWETFLKLKASEKARPTTKDTVGAVALDRHGDLASATSTGGMLDKLPGRVGDAPLIGVGTYADNRTCAVSCTGWGEFFIRAVVAYDVSARMAYQGAPLDKAARAALDAALKLGGEGGLIALDAAGHVTQPFNTPGMFRGFRFSDGRASVALFGEGAL